MSGRLITNLCGLVIGVAIVAGIILGNLRSIQHLPYWPVWVAICLLLGGLIGYAVASFAVVRLYRLVHDSIRRMNVTDVIAAVVGLTLGLIIAALLTLPLSQLSVSGLNHWLPTVAAIACGFLGVTAA